MSWRFALVLAAALVAASLASSRVRSTLYARLRPRRSIDEVLAEIGAAADQRLRPYFERAAITYPPNRVALLGFKAEKRLELWAPLGERWTLVREWPVLAASGGPGPKLREGDRQIPEGVYPIVALNPNSRFHLSLEVGYPNEFDLRHARAEGREPGGEIFVHGSDRSVGCLAIGDEAIEELFVLAARVGIERIELLLAPNDVRTSAEFAAPAEPPPWLPQLHATLRERLRAFAR